MATKKTTTSLDELKCPNCGTQIPLSEMLSHQIGERAREEMRSEVVAAQADVTRREEELKRSEKEAAKKLADQVAAATARITAEERERATQEAATRLSAATAETTRMKEALAKAQASELELRNKASELEERAASLDLEVARKVDEGKRAITTAIEERLKSEMTLKVGEKDKQLQDAMSMIARLQEKIEAGSQQLQGEVLELEIEKVLAATFPLDEILPVPKGINGADIIQQVNRRSGGSAGQIIWELKRTKTFNKDWPAKLKADQRVAKADIAVLISSALPDEIKTFGQLDGVWVCGIEHAINLAHALRVQLLEVDLVRAAQSGKTGKMELMYEYLSGPGFRQRVEAIVEAFTEMQSDIAEERRVAERRWAKREKQVAQVINSTSGMYGDLQGMIGSTMQTMPQLEHKV